MQEAYCPPCSHSNFLAIVGGGSLNKNFFFPVWTCIKPNLLSKIFPFTKTGYPPQKSETGYPSENLRPGTPPRKSETRCPPQKSETRYPPWKSETRYPSPKIWDQVPPPEMLTDRHLWKQYLPVILRMRAVISHVYTKGTSSFLFIAPRHLGW